MGGEGKVCVCCCVTRKRKKTQNCIGRILDFESRQSRLRCFPSSMNSSKYLLQALQGFSPLAVSCERTSFSFDDDMTDRVKERGGKNKRI